MVGVYIYLGTVVVCHAINSLVIQSIEKESKNRGYESVEESTNIARDILTYIKFLGLSIVPLLNIAITCVMLLRSNKLLEEVIKDRIEEGTLVKVEEIKEDESIVKERVITYNVNNELTREEKIEFLKQELNRLTGKDVIIEETKKVNKKGGYGTGRR